MTRFGTLRLRIARTRGQAFLPAGIECCFVEVRRRTRPMVCFVNIHSVDRIVFSIFNRVNPQWKNRTLRIFTQAA